MKYIYTQPTFPANKKKKKQNKKNKQILKVNTCTTFKFKNRKYKYNE